MSDPVVIKLLGVAGWGELDLDSDRYLRNFDVNARAGRGATAFTRDPYGAMRFANAAEAMRTWQTQSSVRPFRDDGLPNRPLTAFTIEVVKLSSVTS
jgi:hypothetical protein